MPHHGYSIEIYTLGRYPTAIATLHPVEGFLGKERNRFTLLSKTMISIMFPSIPHTLRGRTPPRLGQMTSQNWSSPEISNPKKRVGGTYFILGWLQLERYGGNASREIAIGT